MAIHRIVKVETLEHYRLALSYADGVEGVVDLSYLVGKGVFSLWEDEEAFRNVTIGPSGELLWGEQVDLCPDSLYLKITGRQPDEVFPQLGRKAAHA